VAQFLRGQGYRAYALRGGFDAWAQAGLPTDPKTAERGRTVADVCPECHGAMSAHAGPRPGG
jgi:3-mercaptopyruvate sulfurtransferase SseA